jgi:ribosome silencing factor RsfS/YbeB/iojap
MATSRNPRPHRRMATPPKQKDAPQSRPASPRSELVALEKEALAALEDMKAVNIRVLDVRGLTDVADTMIVASGTSDRHVRSIAENVVVKAKQAGRRPMGTEGRAGCRVGADRPAGCAGARHAAAGARVLRARAACGSAQGAAAQRTLT